MYGGYDLPLPTKVRSNSYGILLLYPLILLLAANYCSVSPYPAAACLQTTVAACMAVMTCSCLLQPISYNNTTAAGSLLLFSL
jgi:hypothetical protein